MSRVLTEIDPTAGKLGTILTSTGRVRLYREVARRSSTLSYGLGYVADTRTSALPNRGEILRGRKSPDEI
jgi:hypothetical protein